MKNVSLFLFVFCLLLHSTTYSQNSESIRISTPEIEYSVERFPLGQTNEEIESLKLAHQSYNDMSDSERALFEESRQNYLNKIALVLNKTKVGFGLLVSSKEFVKKVREALSTARPHIPEGEIGIIVRRAMEEEQERLRLSPEEKKSLQEKGHFHIQGLLNKINRSLYEKSRLVIQSDEIGFSVGVGLGANTGVSKYVVGGIAEISFLFGFNRKTKTFTFEIHGIAEHAKYALTPLLMVGVDIRSGLYFKNSSDRSIQKGESLFTPAIPTAFSSYPSHVDSYFSTGIGFPPMATEFMGYVSTSYRIPLFRIEMSLDPMKFKVLLGFNPFKPKRAVKVKCAELMM
ncbi:MAG: hypothetical protein ABL930_04795 [Pseudobdellovibrio sp.]